MTEYLIEYLGTGGIEVNATYRGGEEGLLREITWIEEHGGYNVTAVHRETGEVVYEQGGSAQS